MELRFPRVHRKTAAHARQGVQQAEPTITAVAVAVARAAVAADAAPVAARLNRSPEKQ